MEEFDKKLHEIIQISRLIGKVYKSIIYDDTNIMFLNELNRLVNIEKKLYQQLDLDVYKEATIRSILCEFENIYGKSLNNVFGAACNDDICDMWLYRIKEKLSYVEPSVLISLVKKVHNKDESISGDDLLDIQCSQINDALSNDFMRSFISFLDEEINSCEEGVLKYNLTETKYKLIYATNLLEEDLLSNKKQEDEFLYMSFGYISDLFLAPKELKNQMQQDAGLSYVDYAISNIELLHDFEDNDEFLNTIFSVYFRAGLTLLYNSKDYELLREDMKMDIMCEDSDNIFADIEEYLTESNRDIAKCKYLSLTNPNNY